MSLDSSSPKTVLIFPSSTPPTVQAVDRQLLMQRGECSISSTLGQISSRSSDFVALCLVVAPNRREAAQVIADGDDDRVVFAGVPPPDQARWLSHFLRNLSSCEDQEVLQQSEKSLKQQSHRQTQSATVAPVFGWTITTTATGTVLQSHWPELVLRPTPRPLGGFVEIDGATSTRVFAGIRRQREDNLDVRGGFYWTPTLWPLWNTTIGLALGTDAAGDDSGEIPVYAATNMLAVSRKNALIFEGSGAYSSQRGIVLRTDAYAGYIHVGGRREDEAQQISFGFAAIDSAFFDTLPLTSHVTFDWLLNHTGSGRYAWANRLELDARWISWSPLWLGVTTAYQTHTIDVSTRTQKDVWTGGLEIGWHF